VCRKAAAIYAGEDCRGALYLDDGHTFAYKKGEYLRVNYTCQTGENSLGITSSARQGSFMPWWNNVQVTVFGSTHPPREVRAGKRTLSDWHYDAKAKAVTLTLPDSATGWELRLIE